MALNFHGGKGSMSGGLQSPGPHQHQLTVEAPFWTRARLTHPHMPSLDLRLPLSHTCRGSADIVSGLCLCTELRTFEVACVCEVVYESTQIPSVACSEAIYPNEVGPYWLLVAGTESSLTRLSREPNAAGIGVVSGADPPSKFDACHTARSTVGTFRCSTCIQAQCQGRGGRCR